MRDSGPRSGRLRPLAVLALACLVGCGGESTGGGEGAGDGAGSTPIAEIGTYLNIVAPSVVEKEEDIRLRLRVVTQIGIPDYDFEGVFRVEGHGDVEFPDPMSLDPDPDGFYFTDGIRFHSTGVQFLRCLVPGDTVKALANPVNVVDHADYRIYWGDLNGHSDISSGIRPRGVYFWYAKAVALLDFVALTDNDAWEDRSLDGDTFAEGMETSMKDLEEPGRFVGLPAFEWTSTTYGNRLVYFPEPPETLPTVAAGYDTPAKLLSALPEGVLVAIPHPSGSETNPPVAPSSVSSENLVEIYSKAGIFESGMSHRPSTRETAGSFVTDLLKDGLRPGFIADSDTRLTTPGNPRPVPHGDFPYSGGLTAVLARELTREAVLDALREHRCYATTGPRYLLEFTVDGHVMGSQLRVPTGHEASVYGSLGSTTNWVRVEIMAPEGTLAVLTPEPGDSDVVELTAKTAPVTGPTWVYLRGVDELGGMAWSSPIFLQPQ